MRLQEDLKVASRAEEVSSLTVQLLQLCKSFMVSVIRCPGIGYLGG
jgi:hypothetical protein